MRIPSTLKPTIAATVLALASGGAASGERYWSFAAGCSSADLTSFCLRASPGGATGASPPGGSDSVFILQSAATELTVRAINAAGTVLPKYQSLVLDGSGAAPAGLRLERGTLSAYSAIVGNSGRGHFTQTGGLAVLDGVTLGYTGYGRYDLQGGELRTQGMALGLLGTGDLVQTGGLLTVSGPLDINTGSNLRIEGGTLTVNGVLGMNHGSTVSLQGGTLDLRGSTGFRQYPAQGADLSSGDLTLAGGTVLTNAGQTLRVNRLQALAGSGEMLRNTALELDKLELMGVARTIELDAQVRSSFSTRVQASIADEQVTVNLRGQGSNFGRALLIGTDINGFGKGRGVLQVLAGGRADAQYVGVGNGDGGVGQVRVSGTGSTLVSGSMTLGAQAAQDQPVSQLMVDLGGAFVTESLYLRDNGAARVMSGGFVRVTDVLQLSTESNRLPSLLISDGGMVSAGATVLSPRTTLGLSGPGSTLATRTLVNNGTTFLESIGARITGVGGVDMPLDVKNGGLLDVRQGANAHVAGAMLNDAGAKVSVGSFAALRLASYNGAGSLAIGGELDASGNGGAQVVIDGATQVQAGGAVQVGRGSTLRMGSYSGEGWLSIGSGARVEVAGDAQLLGDASPSIGAGAVVTIGGALQRGTGTVAVSQGASVHMGSSAGVGKLVVSDATATVAGALQFDLLGDGSIPFVQLAVNQGGRLEAGSLALNGAGVAIVGPNGRLVVTDTLTLRQSGSLPPRLEVTGAGTVSAGATVLNVGTKLQLTGPSSSLATRTLTNSGSILLTGLGTSITGLGGVGPLDVHNGRLLELDDGAATHVAGAVRNNLDATVYVGTGASLRMGSYSGAGVLFTLNGTRLTVDGAMQVQRGGFVGIQTGSSLRTGALSVQGTLHGQVAEFVQAGPVHIERDGYIYLQDTTWSAGQIVNDGLLGLTRTTLLRAADGSVPSLLNNGRVLVRAGRSVVGDYAGTGTILFDDARAASIEFQGQVERHAGSTFSVRGAREVEAIYRAQVMMDLQSGGISDVGVRTTFTDSAIVTLGIAAGEPGTTPTTAFFSSGLTLGGSLQLDFGSGNTSGLPASAPQLQAGWSMDLFDSLALTGSFASVSLLNATLAPGAVLDLSRLSTDGIVRVVQAAAVPEPGTWALWLGGLVGLGWRQARQRAKPSGG